MTIWELLEETGEDYTAWDRDVDAEVEIIAFEPKEGDCLDSFLYELYRRVELSEMPEAQCDEIVCDFYGFVKNNIEIFDKHFVLEEDDPAAGMVEHLNEVCAGYCTDKDYASIAEDLAKLPVPAKNKDER